MSGETPDALHIPRGELLRARVVESPQTVLASALDRDLTGYATLVPQDALMLDGDARGVVTFEDGVPVLAYNTATDNGGADALADLAVPGPYRIELFAVDAAALAEAHDTPELTVPPGMPAEELADAPDLADDTRAAAPTERLETDEDASAVESFLADGDRIDAIREQAREEAAERAAEWGLDDQLEETEDPLEETATELASADNSDQNEVASDALGTSSE
ncbi:hypothetical protein [Haloparvum sp. PAK95]|uniref:hypothetical protein n=1 Tax=Haloparvum sp. PAK95 TaxID=3418962 RepID=UPI003D2EA6B4